MNSKRGVHLALVCLGQPSSVKMRFVVRAVLVTFLAICQLEDVFSKSNIIRQPRLKSSEIRRYRLNKCVNCMKAFTLGRPGLKFNNTEYMYAVVSLI